MNSLLITVNVKFRLPLILNTGKAITEDIIGKGPINNGHIKVTRVAT